MGLTLVCLHGLTQNGSALAAQLTALTSRFPTTVDVLCPDAPLPCDEETVQRMAAPEQAPPHLRWWVANEDHSLYQGWDQTLEQLHVLCDQPGPIAVLGFSQGAIAAAALAGLHAAGQFPKLEFAVMIAGRKPRSSALSPLYAAPLALPSLHIWGDKDGEAVKSGPELADAFSEDTREIVVWSGGHSVPTQGPAADAILERVNAYA